MKILLADTQKYLRVTYQEIKVILMSGLTFEQWTEENISTLLH